MSFIYSWWYGPEKECPKLQLTNEMMQEQKKNLKSIKSQFNSVEEQLINVKRNLKKVHSAPVVSSVKPLPPVVRVQIDLDEVISKSKTLRPLAPTPPAFEIVHNPDTENDLFSEICNFDTKNLKKVITKEMISHPLPPPLPSPRTKPVRTAPEQMNTLFGELNMLSLTDRPGSDWNTPAFNPDLEFDKAFQPSLNITNNDFTQFTGKLSPVPADFGDWTTDADSDWSTEVESDSDEVTPLCRQLRAQACCLVDPNVSELKRRRVASMSDVNEARKFRVERSHSWGF